MSIKPTTSLPKDGIAGLREHYKEDALSGFLVFLLALPLSLGIAKASDFPPIMGLITAMIGGLAVSLIAGSPLTIKGPAAGLIVIVAGAVAEFGRGDAVAGWHLALGAIAIAGLLQIVFGFLKIGTIADLFPLSTIQGMLTAIGIIIFSKQAHVILGVNPVDEAGRAIIEPFELIMAIPHTIKQLNLNAFIIGALSLVLVFVWPKFKGKFFKKIPAPIVVLILAIPVAKYIGLDRRYFIHFDQSLMDTLVWNADFSGIVNFPWIFVKYVLMFALVGSLESLLTVKATDFQDPWRRKSNANKDLMAVGAGNAIAGVLGGLPMISEVARSSANIENGGKTRWSNLFHGIFMLIFLIMDLTFNDLIPIPALAAMLIAVGYRLASPKTFGEMAKVGAEQLFVYVVTIIVTLLSDLLLGIAAGVATKLFTQFVLGTPFGAMFKSHIVEKGNEIRVGGAAVFSNWLGLKRHLSRFDRTSKIKVDLTYCNLVDYTVIDNLHHLKAEFELSGGELLVTGLQELEYTGKNKHHQATRNKPKTNRLSLAEAKRLIAQ